MAYLVSKRIFLILSIGPGLGLEAGKEHLIKITMNLEWKQTHIRDSFMWDITDPNNNPEEFAA